MVELVERAGRTAVHDPESAFLLGIAAAQVGSPDLAVRWLAVAVNGLRHEGRLGSLARAAFVYGFNALPLADWKAPSPQQRKPGGWRLKPASHFMMPAAD